jgi:hypothetical protein
MTTSRPGRTRRRRGRLAEQEPSPGKGTSARGKRRKHRRSTAVTRTTAMTTSSLLGSSGFWHAVSTGAPATGLALVAILLWGIVFRNDVWSARTFVLLFYGALFSTVVAHGGPRWMASKGWPPVRPWVSDIRGGLSVFVFVFVAWAWLPFLTRPFVGWVMRMASFLRYF